MPKEVFYQNEGSDEEQRRQAILQWGGALSEDVYLITRQMDEDRNELPGTGTAVKLNRSSLNALIRTLRHARDKAFGPDE